MRQAGIEASEKSRTVIRHYRIPGGRLGEFVGLFWFYEGYSVAHPRERLLPGATTELVFELRPGARECAAAVVAGPHSEYSVLDTSAEISLIGVHFKVGGSFPFFGMPAAELHNLDVPLQALWGARAAHLRERLSAAATADEKFDILEQTLLHLQCDTRRHPAIAFALRELSTVPQRLSLAALADEVGMSQRRLIERFRTEVGMTPKLFARVQRFQATIRAIQPLADVDWAQVAADCGYFDQAHLIHDFRGFAGLTPTEYLQARSEHLNHVPLRQ